MEIEEDWTSSPESEEIKYDEEENQDKILKKRDDTKDF